MRKPGKYMDEVLSYAHQLIDGTMPANHARVLAAERFIRMLESDQYDVRPRDADFVVGIIERVLVHRQGEKLDGTPLRGTPLLLEPWQKFVVYGLLIFYKKGTNERLVKEGMIFIPRKNGKTMLVSALSFGLALLEAPSGSKVYVVGAALKQAKETFDTWLYNVEHHMYQGRSDAKKDGWRILDNNLDHSISNDNIAGGSISLIALASNPDSQDSFNCNIVIADEIHAYKTPKQYNILKEATNAYTNKLVIAISTAGDDGTGFCAQRIDYCKKVLEGTVSDDQYFIFLCQADADPKTGDVDYTNPLVLESANPSYGVTIRPDAILSDAMQAYNDPQQRKDFFAKRINIFTSSVKAWFDVSEFKRSDEKCAATLGIDNSWPLHRKLNALAKLGVSWYGGADLSRLYDLTAACLHGQYKGIDIVIPHCWFPITQAAAKADEDNIPLFGWADDGYLTMINTPTNDGDQVCRWFKDMRGLGFKIAQVGHDRKFARDYFVAMKKAGFRIIDQPQRYWIKSEGFRHIEKAAKDGTLYYLGAEPYEYCVQNVSAIEKSDDMVQYEKVQPNHRIDIFDADVFAVVRMLECADKSKRDQEWLDG